MAECKLQGFDEFLRKMYEMEEGIGDVAAEALNRAAPTLADALKQCIRESANRVDRKGNPYSTGELADSIVPTQAKMNGYGYFIAARPVGTDERGTRNGEKLAYLEYGTSQQDAHPVIERAAKMAGTGCSKSIQDTIDEYVDRLWK